MDEVLDPSTHKFSCFQNVKLFEFKATKHESLKFTEIFQSRSEKGKSKHKSRIYITESSVNPVKNIANRSFLPQTIARYRRTRLSKVSSTTTVTHESKSWCARSAKEDLRLGTR